MVTLETGDFWSCSAKMLVNPVNCVGVMGAGLAGEFKHRYPKMFDHYRKACLSNEVVPGKLHVYYDPEKQATVINLPTKRHWRNKSELGIVDAGLTALRTYLEPFCNADDAKKIDVLVPALGCGRGGLDWSIVHPLILDRLKNLEIRIHLFPPREIDQHPSGKQAVSCASLLRTARRAIVGCTRCELHLSRTRIVPSVGTGEAGIAFVGEAPGAEEDARGIPFVGRAGTFLRKLIVETKGPPIDSILIVNTLQCRPPDNRTPETEELQACKQHLWRQLDAIKPRVVVCVGKTSATLMTQGKRGEAMENLCGRWLVMNWWGTQHPVLRVIYHPSYLLQHGRGHIEETRVDLQEVWKMLAKKQGAKP